MSTSGDDDDDFGSDPFGLRELYRNNRGLPSNASVAAVASPCASASSAIASGSDAASSLAASASSAPGACAASGAASVVAPTASSSVIDDEACQRSFPPLSDKSMSAWARAAEMPKHCEIVRMGRWQHKAHLHGPLVQLVACCQASIADDPVHIVQPTGQEEQTVTQIAAKLLGVIDAYAASGAAEVAFGKKACVYVGACVDVKYRWHGTTREKMDEWRRSGVSLAERRRRFYPGHKLKYAKMFVLGSADAMVSIILEPFLISVAQCRCEVDGALECENKEADGRGQSCDHNWMYACIGEVPVAPLSSLYKQRPSPFALS